MTEITIAAVQFTSGNDIDANLARMVELIDAGADAGADLVVFQEFTNHPCYYSSPDHVWQSAIHENGPYVQTLGERARERGVYVSFNATVRRAWPTVEDQNFLISSTGEVVLTSQKQILMGSEQDYFAPGRSEAQLVDTEFGRIGLMSCMEGLIPETPRVLAVKGADLILNSLSSNGIDEAHTHIPVRAAENGVFVVSANRSGPLVDAVDMDGLAVKLGFDTSKLQGGGESQVVAPDGESLVRAQPFRDDLVVTTIDLASARPEDLLAGRRPECYALLAADPDQLAEHLAARPEQARELTVATVTPQPGQAVDDALREALQRCEEVDADLIVLPELFAWQVGDLAGTEASGTAAEAQRAIDALVEVAGRKRRHIVAGVPVAREDGLANSAVLIGPTGLLSTYDQVHVHPDDQTWASPGSEFVVADLPFGRLGLMLGNDLAYPESARILSLKGADLIACPMTWRRPWESRLGAPERAAENHVSVVVAARADSASPAPSTILAVPGEYRFPATGEVNMPDRFDAADSGQPHVRRIDLAPSRDKRLMRRTDLLAHRQPHLYTSLTEVADLVGASTSTQEAIAR